MSNYEKANSDNRDVLERFLPAIYRKTTDGSDEHNAFLGAIKGMISTTESDLVENVKQIYLAKATGSFLDLYGKWVGISRSIDESDDDYRSRIEEYILTERATISGIIAGIRRELHDPDLPISIYEPWRNIFILNKSLLNGPDRIMGNFYRYAVIQVTVGKYVDKDTLNTIMLKYKAYGIYVFYVYSSAMTGDVLGLPLNLIGTGQDTTNTNKLFNNYNFGINDLPNGSTVDNLFIVNESKLNGDKLLAGSPENTFAYQYGDVPSKNIFGIVDKASDPTSFTDPYDYVYQGTKVDMSSVGGRNLLLNTGIVSSSSNMVHAIGKTPQFQPSVSFPSVGETQVTSNGKNEMYYRFSNPLGGDMGNFVAGNTYTFSVDIKGTVPYIYTRWQYKTDSGAWKDAVGSATQVSGQSDDYSRVSVVFTVPSSATSFYLSLQGYKAANAVTDSGQSFTFKNAKLENGNTATDWTPAPEDSPKTYIYPYKNTSFVNMGRKDGIVESLENTSTSLLTVALNVSEYLNTKGYSDTISSYNRDTTESIILSIEGSPYGVSSTNMVVYSASGSTILGSWYTYEDNKKGTLVGASIPALSSSTKKYVYVLSSPQSVSKIVLNDYYPARGAYRSLSLLSGGNTLRVHNTIEQVAGTITLPVSQSLSSFYVSAYVDSIYLDVTSTSVGYSVYSYDTQKWVPVDNHTNLLPYIETGTTTGGTYLLIRSNSQKVESVDYLGLKIKSYT